MQVNSGFGQLDSLVDDIKKKESDRVKLESQVRQLRLRAEAEAADAKQVKAELETAQADRVSLQKKIGLLTRQNEDLSAENAKLVAEKCDFQRSMANNEAKLKENEEDFRRAQREFVERLEEANRAYSQRRAMMKALLGRKQGEGGGVEVPSPDELESLRSNAARTQDARFRVAELEAQIRGLEAGSQALRNEATEGARAQESLRAEIVSWKDKVKAATSKNKTADGQSMEGGAGQAEKDSVQHLDQLQRQVASLEDTCNRQTDYINQLEEYANSLEAANAQLMPPQDAGAGERENGCYQEGEHVMVDSMQCDEERLGGT